MRVATAEIDDGERLPDLEKIEVLTFAARRMMSASGGAYYALGKNQAPRSKLVMRGSRGRDAFDGAHARSRATLERRRSSHDPR